MGEGRNRQVVIVCWFADDVGRAGMPRTDSPGGGAPQTNPPRRDDARGDAAPTEIVPVDGWRPFAALLARWLGPGEPPDRCVIVKGRGLHSSRRASRGDEEFRALVATADALLADPRLRREPLIVRSGDPATDTLLAGLAPALVALLDRLTTRQREVGRLLLVDGLRRAQIAERRGISRPTVSVMVDRARLPEIGRLARALDVIFQGGAGQPLRSADAPDRPIAPATTGTPLGLRPGNGPMITSFLVGALVGNLTIIAMALAIAVDLG